MHQVHLCLHSRSSRLHCTQAQLSDAGRLVQQLRVPVIALVGYTNAGKSTLLNALTGADILAEDKLFATLDPTTRKLNLPSGTEVRLHSQCMHGLAENREVGWLHAEPQSAVELFFRQEQGLQHPKQCFSTGISS